MTSLCIGGFAIFARAYNEGNEDLTLFIGLLWTGSWVWSIVDAPISAKNINRERQQELHGHMLQFDVGRYALGVDLTSYRDAYGATVSYTFDLMNRIC